MKLFKLMKDGGPESRVWGYFLVEIKKLCTAVLLNFKDGSREAYHTHAFNAISWVLKGKLTEHVLGSYIYDEPPTVYTPSFKPIFTPRDMFHKVVSEGNTWVISFRGPWVDSWKEWLPVEKKSVTLTHGRKVVTGRMSCTTPNIESVPQRAAA